MVGSSVWKWVRRLLLLAVTSTVAASAAGAALYSYYARKIREWILTPRMEKALTKDEILNLYVNTINFGHARYGVEEASLFYFGKHAKDLTLGEAAVIAGTVQLPERINPVTNAVKAKKRQRYVLGQLAKHAIAARAIAGRSATSRRPASSRSRGCCRRASRRPGAASPTRC